MDLSRPITEDTSVTVTHFDTKTRETVPEEKSWEHNTKLRTGIQEGLSNEF